VREHVLHETFVFGQGTKPPFPWHFMPPPYTPASHPGTPSSSGSAQTRTGQLWLRHTSHGIQHPSACGCLHSGSGSPAPRTVRATMRRMLDGNSKHKFWFKTELGMVRPHRSIHLHSFYSLKFTNEVLFVCVWMWSAPAQCLLT
jgi:hypothetical protein